MTKQVPSKHDTTRTVISILPLATFHQWLIKLVDCSTQCANLTSVSLLLFLSLSLQLFLWTPVQTVTVTDIVLKQWRVCCLGEWVFFRIFFFFFSFFFFEVFAKKKKKTQSTLYGSLTLLHFSVDGRPGSLIELDELDHWRSEGLKFLVFSFLFFFFLVLFIMN